MKEYLSSTDLVLGELHSTPEGFTSEQARETLHTVGPNRLKEQPKETMLHRFLKELMDPMTLILLAAALLSGITSFYAGESFADVVIILIVVIINAVLGVFQESKAEKAIEALQEITAATSKVMRDGYMTTVKSEELVPGDIIMLEAGDAVPADARIIECASLKVEESALTGESVPVDKIADALTSPTGEVPLGDRKNMAYMGSTVVYGRGRLVVTATGMNTEMGKIADALENAADEKTPLQMKLAQLSKVLSILVLVICAVILLVDLIRMYPNFTGAKLIDTFMVAVSLAVAAIPEGLAAVVTIVLSIGVTNMSKKSAVIRKLTAVETLGCTQVICSDKTGTLTQNKMTVVKRISDDEKRTATALSMCSDSKLDEQHVAVGEPTENALVNDAYTLGIDKNELERDLRRVGEAPFDSVRKLMSTIHTTNSGFVQYTKGAPDELLRKCTTILTNGQIIPLMDEKRKEILAMNHQMATEALRVLAAAERTYEVMPSDTRPEAIEQDLTFLGLVGMMDPIRPEVKAAMAKCREAGIRAVMITGDHKDTASAIAKDLGILEGGREAITGADLDQISEEDFANDVEKYAVYARVQPEHKVRIVSAWKAKGKITAMTGDGVNDAPSIKTADIGIGMGITGTDVTKNVADMVLADDNFATIVSAVEEGRRIYDNIRKAIQFLLASNLAEVIAIFFSTLLGFTILKPVHLLWINLITDCFPALSLGVERQEEGAMTKPPRNSKDGIFADGMGFDILTQGLAIALLTMVSYFIGHYMEAARWEIVNSQDGMTMAFLTLSMMEVFHSFNMRSRRGSLFTMKNQNKLLWLSFVVSFILTAAVIFVPFLSKAFGFTTISIAEYFVAMGIAVLIIPIMEVVKLIQRKLGK